MELEQVRRAIEEAGADWTAGETALSGYEVEPDQMEFLGYVPGPDEPSLDEQEALAEEVLEAVFAEEPTYPPSHDWRDAAGANFVTPIREQAKCGSCVAFACCAVVEATTAIVRNEPDLDIDLSEAHLFYCIARSQGRRCRGRPNGGWWPRPALDAFRDQGVADEACYPYRPGDQDCINLCEDWSARVTTIAGWQELTSHEDMKSWLAQRGPLVATMKTYEDFVRYYRGGVYKRVGGAEGGGHCITIIGYDDGAGAWIGKNSWGTDWGEAGFFRIAYGECAVDSSMWAVEV